jgi:hypothetical protein
MFGLSSGSGRVACIGGRGARVIVLAFCLSSAGFSAQVSDDGPWGVYQRFQGSATSDYGQILKLDTGLTYDLGPRVRLGIGAPYYLVHDTTGTEASFRHGVGNLHLDFGFFLPDGPIRYSSTFELGLPTGDEAEGYGTGTVTVDWTIAFSLPLEDLTPFLNVGFANTVSDTSFFTRPFSSLGLVTHLQGGAQRFLGSVWAVGASGYAILPSGEQTVVTRVPRTESGPGGGRGRPFDIRREVVGNAELARDHGLSGWLSLYPAANLDFYAGYTRSTHYGLGSAFFGFGWSVRGL